MLTSKKPATGYPYPREQAGKEVRDAIKRIGGNLPEQIPPAEHIKQVEQRIKASTPKLELDKRDASGLLGDASAKNKDK
jgi:DNA-damage-inducible protein D